MPHTRSGSRPHILRLALRRIVASGPGSWAFSRLGPRLDRPVFRATRGRFTFASAVLGVPVLLLTTRGARTGRPRSTPVLGLPTPEGLAVIASNWGQPRHPAWYHNLRAHPEAEISIRGERRQVRADRLEGARRARAWAAALEVYAGFAVYERRAEGREIPVLILDAGETEGT